MTKISIVPVHTGGGGRSYLAVAGAHQSEGATPGAALDALTSQLPDDETATVVVVQSGRPDRFFSGEQQRRLADLMDRWRAARDAGRHLTDVEREELDALIEQEIRASADRSTALLNELAE